MSELFIVLSLFSIPTVFTILDVGGVKIQFFKYGNFTELVWESNSTRICTDFPRDKITELDSIRADTCFIVFNERNCRSYLSKKYMPGDIILSQSELGRHRSIYSFRICHDEEAVEQLNFDIVEFLKKLGRKSRVAESYRNVCSCINLPQYVQELDRWTINNHYNSMLAYFEPDCSENKWKSEFMEAGHYGYEYKNFQSWKRVGRKSKVVQKIQSFGPDPNSTYFKTTCLDLSHQETKENDDKTFKSTAEIKADVNTDNYIRLRVVTNQTTRNVPVTLYGLVILFVLMFCK